MKIKKGFVMRKMGDKTVVVATGDASAEFHGMIELNQTAADIWNWVAEGLDQNAVASNLAQKYNLESVKAKADTDKIINQMKQTGVFENE